MSDLAQFVQSHPGCTVGDIVDHLGGDAADAWEAIQSADRAGLIRKENSDGGRWHFFPACTTT